MGGPNDNLFHSFIASILSGFYLDVIILEYRLSLIHVAEIFVGVFVGIPAFGKNVK